MNQAIKYFNIELNFFSLKIYVYVGYVHVNAGPSEARGVRSHRDACCESQHQDQEQNSSPLQEQNELPTLNNLFSPLTLNFAKSVCTPDLALGRLLHLHQSK